MPDFAATAVIDLTPYDLAQADRLSRELGVSHVVAQVLVRRGFTDPTAAREWLDAGVEHPLAAFGGLAEAAELILDHVARGSRITVHGDYDCDGVCSTAILLRALRSVGARADWYLPSRKDDGYGLAEATVRRLAAAGTNLLVTADCAITAVDEVALARQLGMDVIVTDHHRPRADGALPDTLIVHPAVGGYPCEELCATGVAHKVAGALLKATGRDPRLADEDLDLVALATIADVVPLVDENRRLVRQGLKALQQTRKPGLRALMQVSRVDPGEVDTQAVGFRLCPRINAAGRLQRADAGLELILTADPDRALEIASELDRVNNERRDVEMRIRFDAEAQVAEQGDQPAYVLASEHWHAGVIGIVASRIAERHCRPAVLIALDPSDPARPGSGSGRSIPAFDLLGGLNACAEHLVKHGGHRAAAGLTIERGDLDAFRDAFRAHAAAVLKAEDLVPHERVDAVVPGDGLGLELAEELERLAPFGMGNPAPTLMVPCATFSDPQPLGAEERHVRFTLTAGGARSKILAFGAGSKMPAPEGETVDAIVRLEANRFRGTVEPRLVLRRVRPVHCGGIEVLGEPECFLTAVASQLDGRAPVVAPRAPGGYFGGGDSLFAHVRDPDRRTERDLRGQGIAGVLGDLVATGEPVLVLCAHAGHRADALRGRMGGFAVAGWSAVAARPELASAFTHLVALDPPVSAQQQEAVARTGPGWLHAAWGEPELQFALRVLDWEHDLRAPLAALYRTLRSLGEPAGLHGAPLLGALQGDTRPARTPALAGRLVRVLLELGLAERRSDVPAEPLALRLTLDPQRTELERSATFQDCERRREEGRRFLSATTSQRAPAAA